MKDEFPEKQILTFSIVGSPKVSDIAVEPYNNTLGLNYLIENAD